MRKIKWLKLISLLIVPTVFISCSKSCRKADDGKPTINVDVSTPLESLDPRYTTAASASRIAKLIYAPLFEIKEDMLPKPFLAESVEALDEKTLKFTLKKGLQFHDGSAL